MIWASTPDGHVTYAGPEWAVFTGQSTESAKGDGWLEMVHVEDRERAYTSFKQACAAVAAFTIEYRLRDATDGYVRVLSGATPSMSPIDGSFIGYLGNLCKIDSQSTRCQSTLGKTTFSQSSAAITPLTSIDMIADHLLLARAAAKNEGEHRLLPSLDFAISEVMRRLGHVLQLQTH